MKSLESSQKAHPLPPVRICITPNCNFNCFYCTPSGDSYCGKAKVVSASIMSEKNLVELLLALNKLGFSDIRWSGGEPLLQGGLVIKISKKMKKLAPKLRFGLTTNGFFLKKFINKLKGSNISEVLVSIDSLKKENFRKISGVDGLERVLEGIKLVKKILPVRINVVLSKQNYDERWAFVDFAVINELNAKFLDLTYFENPGEKIWDKNFVELTDFVRELKTKFKQFEIVWRRGEIGIPMTQFKVNKSSILIKDSSLGTHYSNECEGCALRPSNNKHYCQEGVYEIFIAYDGRCAICKHRANNGIKISQEDFNDSKALEKKLTFMKNFYQHLKFYPGKNFSK